MAEVRGFRARVLIDQFGIAGENEQRREARRHDVGLTDVIVLQMEFVELPFWRTGNQANPECELRCNVFRQNPALWDVYASVASLKFVRRIG